jgi:CheY-like chemotaxis protein
MKTPQARILIADDVPDVVQLLRDFLIEQGYDVQTATTGIEALNAVVTFQPDVILLEMQMPGLSGMKVLDELRRAGLTVPVILISADASALLTRYRFATGGRYAGAPSKC